MQPGGLAVGAGHEPEVGAAGSDVGIDLGELPVFHAYLRAGVLRQEPLDVVLDHVDTGAVDGGDLYLVAGPVGPEGPDAGDGAVVKGGDLFRGLVELLAAGGQQHPAGLPVVQLAFQHELQLLDLLADGRLGHVVKLGGLRETAGVVKVAEDFKGFDVHI